MREICPKELCVGCLSCVNSCTHQAIEFEKDVCGFRYPIIDQEKCVDCGLCGFVCPVNHPPEKYFPKECYAVTVKSGNYFLVRLVERLQRLPGMC